MQAIPPIPLPIRPNLTVRNVSNSLAGLPYFSSNFPYLSGDDLMPSILSTLLNTRVMQEKVAEHDFSA
jgi:hypothetical protein